MFTLPRAEVSCSPIYALLQWMWDLSRDTTLHQLQACGEREVERIARDNGLSTADFRALASLGPNASDLLERRMAALDLDPTEVSATVPQTFHDLQRVCSFCKDQRRCLRNRGCDSANAARKDYCPNVETLMALDALPWASRREW